MFVGLNRLLFGDNLVFWVGDGGVLLGIVSVRRGFFRFRWFYD